MEEIPDSRFCVYIHRRPDTDAIFYVGIGLPKRPRDVNGRNKYWKNIVAKNNGEFIVEVLHVGVSQQFAKAKEIELIAKYGRKDTGSGILCNLTDGGDGTSNYKYSKEYLKRLSERMTGKKIHLGIKHSEETRAKMRASHQKRMTPVYRKGMSERAMGRIWSEESRKKQSLSQAGRLVSRETRIKISIANTGKKRSDASRRKMSLSQAGKVISYENVRKSVIGKIVSRGWVLEQYCLISGNTINTFLGGSEASKKTGINESSISCALNGFRNIKSAGGFGWRKCYDLSNLHKMAA